MKDAVLNYEQKLYIDGTQMRGVQSVNGSYSISEKPINILGYGHVEYTITCIHVITCYMCYMCHI